MQNRRPKSRRKILHLAYYANARVRGSWPRLASRLRFSWTRGAVSSCSQRGRAVSQHSALISRHSLGQGRMLLIIVGYPLTFSCVSSGENWPRVSWNIIGFFARVSRHNSWTQWFQENPHNVFDLRCLLSTLQRFQDEQTLYELPTNGRTDRQTDRRHGQSPTCIV